VLAVVMAMGFVFPVPADPQLYFTVVEVAVEVDADSNEPPEDSPGEAKSSVPEVTLHVIAKAVAPAGPAVPVCTTAVTAVAPIGIATAAAINRNFLSIS
jgi:hypothetical protein